MLLAGCSGEVPEQPVRAADHDSFFLWAGVKPPDLLDKAKSVYILAGEVRAADNSRFVPLRPEAPSADHAEIWLVLRVERLDWQPQVTRQLLGELARWKAAGAKVEGVQVDFDAATLQLDGYAQFLKALRADLPKDAKLSVTGLMDWSANGDPTALAALGSVVDEVVIQTYQDRSTIPGYENYLASLVRLDLPYKVGLVDGGKWRAPPGLASDPDFEGYVVFLLP